MAKHIEVIGINCNNVGAVVPLVKILYGIFEFPHHIFDTKRIAGSGKRAIMALRHIGIIGKQGGYTTTIIIG